MLPSSSDCFDVFENSRESEDGRKGVPEQRSPSWSVSINPLLPETLRLVIQIYCLAWNYNLIITSFLLFLSTLILAPATRELCFRAPQHNKEGIDSCSKLTDHGDEAGVGPAATEAAANQWVKSMQGLLKSIASPTGGGEGADKIGKLVSEEVNGVMVQDMRREQALDGGNEDEPVDKKALTIEQYGKPAMRIIGGLADKWERIAKWADG